MNKPKIAVLIRSEERHTDGSTPRLSAWAQTIAAEFVAIPSSRELSKHHFDAAVIDQSIELTVGAPLWAEVAAAQPALPLVVWGSEPLAIEALARRSAPCALASSEESLREFVSAEISDVARGRLSGVSLPSVLQVLQIERRTCRLRVRNEANVGELFVRQGALVHASYRKFAPRDAALELLSWECADVVIDRLPLGVDDSLTESLDFMLFEAARVRDESAALGAPGSVRMSGSSALSTASWLVPAVLRGDARALCAEAMKIPGTTAAAVIDFEHRVVVAQQQRADSKAAALHDTISDVVSAASRLLASLDARPMADDVIFTAGSLFVMLRPLRAASMVFFVAIDSDSSALGLARAHLSKLTKDFGVSAA